MAKPADIQRHPAAGGKVCARISGLQENIAIGRVDRSREYWQQQQQAHVEHTLRQLLGTLPRRAPSTTSAADEARPFRALPHAIILEMLDFLPRHRIGNDVPRLHQLVRQAFTERARHQARDHVGTRHGDDEREKKIRQNNFETNAHRGLFFSDRGPLILL